ncbi:MAG TPA: hypothetical protein VH165_07990 [Kofleriaceae bacterium]|nr:hypothetical protein [Kofleriaceae bacterium]
MPEADASAGQRAPVTVPEADAGAAAPEDATDALAQATALADAWNHRVARARRWELALHTVLHAEPKPVRQIRCAAELVLARLDDALGRAARRGLWSPAIEQLLAQLDQLAELWARAVADRAGDGWLAAADRLAGATARRRTWTAGPACDRCGAPSDRWIFEFAVDDLQQRLDCRVCGFRAAHATDAVPLVVQVPAVLPPGHTVRCQIARAGGEPAGYLAYQLTDKGRGTRIASGAVPVEGRAILDLAIPADLTPDLHTLSVAWIHDLDIAIHRARIPGAP